MKSENINETDINYYIPGSDLLFMHLSIVSASTTLWEIQIDNQPDSISALTPKICTFEKFSVTFDDFWTLKMRNDSPNGGYYGIGEGFN